MELEGRPDGTTPYGYQSVLDYYLTMEEAHSNGEELVLSEDVYNTLQQEAVQYYYRYLAFLALGYLDGVIRDTAHNIDIFNFVARHAKDEEGAWQFLQLPLRPHDERPRCGRKGH